MEKRKIETSLEKKERLEKERLAKQQKAIEALTDLSKEHKTVIRNDLAKFSKDSSSNKFNNIKEDKEIIELKSQLAKQTKELEELKKNSLKGYRQTRPIQISMFIKIETSEQLESLMKMENRRKVEIVEKAIEEYYKLKTNE